MSQNKVKLSLTELQGKSQEELLSIAQKVMDVKRFRKSKRLDDYLKTANSGQLEFHKANYRQRFFLAGNRSGKSTAGCVEFVWRCLGMHPFFKTKTPIKSVIVVPDFENHAKNVLEPKLNEWVPEGAMKKIERNQAGAIKKIVWVNGSTTDVLSHDQELKAFEGSDYDLGWFDEPPPHKIWIAVWRGMTDRGGLMYLTGTPLSSPWLYQEYSKIKDGTDDIRKFFQFSSNINAKNIGEGDEALGLQRLKDFADSLTQEERTARLDGGFIQLQGLIFKNWDRSIHLISTFPWPHNWEIIESIDPHPNKPWAVTWLGIAGNGAKVLLKSALFDGVLDDIANGILVGRTQLGIKEELKPKIVRTLIDNASSVPLWQRSNTDPTARRISVREELENMIGPRGAGGPRVEVAPKNVTQKIDIFKRWLHTKLRNGIQRADFYVFNTADNQDFVNEIENYAWQMWSSRSRDGFKTEPVKKNDDLLDSIMQVCLTLGDTNSNIDNLGPVSMVDSFSSWGGAGKGSLDGRQSVQTGPDFIFR